MWFDLRMQLLGKTVFLNKTLYLIMQLLQIVTFLNEVNSKNITMFWMSAFIIVFIFL